MHNTASNPPSRRHLLLTVAAALTLAIAPAWAGTVVGSSRTVSQTRAVSGFSAIQLEASMKLVVRQSGTESLQLRGDDNLLPLIETFVESRGSQPTLVIRWKRGTSIRDSDDVEIVVDAAQVNGLSTSGSGSIEAAALRTDRLRLAVAGSGDIRVDELAAGELDASIAGSGDVRVGGRAARIKVSVAGSGDADLSRLTADEAKVSIAGSGDVDVTADQALSVSIAGSGDVRYGGQVTAVKTSIVGSGDVRRR